MHIAELAGKDDFSRRFFLEKTAQTTLGVSLASIFAAPKGRAQEGGRATSLIYLYLSGGMSHLDTFDPKDSRATMGKTEAMGTNVDGIRLGNLLPSLAKKADKLAIINGMSSFNGAHERGRYQMLTGYNKLATIVHPRVGPFAEELLGRRNEVLPDSVVVGESTSNAGYLDPSRSPLPIADPAGGVPNTMLLTDDDRFVKRMAIADKLGRQFLEKYQYNGPKSYVEYYDQATKLLRSDALQAFDISSEPLREKYGTNRMGQGLLLARRLVEHGVRVVEVHAGGWDMHEGIDTRLEEKLPELDQAVAALLEDLESKGLLDTTLFAIGTEFGRTPDINFNGGRDHHPSAYSTVLAGGGVVGGQIIGESDKQGKKIVSGKVTPEDFIATIGYGLGVPLDEKIYSPTGRPFTFSDKGKPVTQLFG